MGSKSRRQKERHQQKQREKQKRRQARARRQQVQAQQRPAINYGTSHSTFPSGVNMRHRQRLAEQMPQTWPGEIAEDVAIFDDSALAALPAELAQQATAVREALQEATESRGDEAVKRVSAIPRSSPLSEWRLFIRGLVDWLAGNTEAAGEAWTRLTPQRRPGRIATSMMLALREDLENASPAQEAPAEIPPNPNEAGDGIAAPPENHFDAQQLYHAKLLRKARFDRAACRIAEAGLKIREESKDLLLGPAKIHWLRQFIKEFEDTEPDLTAALSQAALARAFVQNYYNLFDEAINAIRGPRHDRKNRLLTFFYYMRIETPSLQKRSQQALDEYLNRDLPQNESLSAPLRRAIASQAHLNEAQALIQSQDRDGIFGFDFGMRDDSKVIRKHLQAAVNAEPIHRAAYKTYVTWIESKLNNDRLAKPKRTALETELAEIMRSWSQSLPDEVEPRLWLVDHYFENDQLEEARPHVEFLSASRHDEPRVRAMPWKWQILEAMRLCRRKGWLADAAVRLDEADKAWPAWLPKQWLPYLRAARTLRQGQSDAFEEQRRQICETSGIVRDSLPDVCMMLGALQQMRVSASDLKPFRAALEHLLKTLKDLPVQDLIDAGSFFWDLHRAQLLYPAYRMHGSIIGKEFVSRLNKSADLARRLSLDERIQKAVLWGSEHRFWATNYGELPAFLSKASTEGQPLLLAAKINALLHHPHQWGIEKFKEAVPELRGAAQLQRDAFYRHWLNSLAEKLDDAMAKQSSRFSAFPFGSIFGDEDDDDEEDDEYEDTEQRRDNDKQRTFDSIPF